MGANTCTIIKEALAIPGKNPKLIFPLFLITFLVNFLFSYALFLAAALSPAPSESVIAQLVLSIVFATVISVIAAIDIYALAMTHAGKQLALLELLVDAKPAIRRFVSTQFLVLFPVCIVYVLALLALMILWIFAGEQIVLRGLIVAAGVAGGVLGFWMLVMWAVISTVTAVEERWGTAAVKRAAEVARGRMWTAVAIMVTGNAVTALAALTPYALMKIIAGEMGVWGEVGVKAVYYIPATAIQFALQGAFAVFYYESKSCGGGEPGTTMVEKGRFYEKLPVSDVA